jgi:hypothetical protein
VTQNLWKGGGILPRDNARGGGVVLTFCSSGLYQDKRLILKSPSHTARVRLLLELFPGARFIHISRNPYEIYSSTHKLHEKLLIQWCLQRPPFEDKLWRRTTILNHFR